MNQVTEKNPLFATHVIEQYASVHADLAKLFGEYYLALVKHGCPEDLAGAMVLDRQAQLMQPPESVDTDKSCNCG